MSSINLRKVVRLADGSPIAIRPIRPGDRQGLHDVHHQLGARSVLGRYGSLLSLAQRTEIRRLSSICQSDQWDTIVLVAIPLMAPTTIIAVGRLMVINEPPQHPFGETAMIVADNWQHSHVGWSLKELLIQAARRRGLHHLQALIDNNNRASLRSCRRHGYAITDYDEDMKLARLSLQ